MIRVDADEVTYPAHVILRYDIEKDLIAGKLQVKDIPEVWNDKMEKMLGVKPPNDKDGCMQDIHWTDGSLGYFPTYTLGAITAAQFFAKAKKDVKGLQGSIKDGDFRPLIDWLTKNIYSKGSLMPAKELVEEVTGEPLNVSIYKEHLRERYL